MGVRKEGSGKSRGVEHAQGRSAETMTNNRQNEVDSGEDSDSELQEVYVQAYACKVFNDAAAARAVEDGAHLRPLSVPQDPEGEPLMLDRFDARWMLDMGDFGKGPMSRVSAKLIAEEQEADNLRYAGLPSGDHSVEVDGLGKFAPSGSYAHGGVLGGLGDEEEEEPPPEVYGYYGRTAAPSSSSTKGVFSATPAPLDGVGVGGGANMGVSLSSSPPGAGDGDRSSEGDGGEAPKAEVFVPDFGVPHGVGIPSTTRQHMMMVGTARKAVRSPQLEVLLRLKQASNAAFSFLSHDDPIHPYYLFLKSWGEVALGKEYARQQQLQVDRAEAKARAEVEEKKRAAAAAKGQLGEGRRRSWHYSLEGFSRAASSAAMSVFFAAHDMQASRRRLVKRHASHPKEAIAYERRLSLTRHTTPGSGLVSAARDHNSFERETLTKNENERRRRPLLLRYK